MELGHAPAAPDLASAAMLTGRPVHHDRRPRGDDMPTPHSNEDPAMPPEAADDDDRHRPPPRRGVVSAPMNLLERIGGPSTIRTVADGLYDRLLADDELGPVFSSTHMPTMRQRLADYLVGACAGEVTVSAERLRAAHARHDVNDRHFSIMASHLADLLADSGIDDDTAADLLDLIAHRRGDVVSHSHVVEEWDPYDDSI
jgi:hemoglobin